MTGLRHHSLLSKRGVRVSRSVSSKVDGTLSSTLTVGDQGHKHLTSPMQGISDHLYRYSGYKEVFPGDPTSATSI